MNRCFRRLFSKHHLYERMAQTGDPGDLKKDSALPRDAEAETIEPVKMGGRNNSNILWTVCSFILVTEMCERLAFYGFSGTLTEFLLSLGNTSTFAAQMTSLFSALVYLTPVFGGYVADQLINRYKTILLFLSFYLFGLVLVAASAYPNTDIDQTSLVLIGLLVFVALGAGGIKANVVTFGADQFDVSQPGQLKQQQSYFNYFYWMINIGALLSYGYLSNLSFNPVVFSGGTIPSNMGYFATYMIPLACLVIATIVYLAGTKRYKITEPTASAFTGFVAVFWEICVSIGTRGRTIIAMILVLMLSIIITVASYFVTDLSAATALGYTAMALILIAAVVLIIFCRDISWIDKSPLSASRSPSESIPLNNVKDMIYLLPFFCMLIIFWVAYTQMSTNFQLQGCQMDMEIGGVVFSPAFFNVFDCLAIITFVPIIDTYIYPCIEKKRGNPIKQLDKMCIGFVFTASAMFVAGLLEIARQNAPTLAVVNGYQAVDMCCTGCVWENDGNAGNCNEPRNINGVVYNCAGLFVNQTVNGVTTLQPAASTCEFNSYCVGQSLKPMKDLSIFWQLFPYMLVGLGEIFTAIPAYDLFYAEVGPEIRSVSQAVNLLSTSFGSFAAGGFNTMFQSWVPNDLNTPQAHLNYIFFIISGLSFLAAVVLKFLAMNHVYRVERPYAATHGLLESDEKELEQGASSSHGLEKMPTKELKDTPSVPSSQQGLAES